MLKNGAEALHTLSMPDLMKPWHEARLGASKLQGAAQAVTMQEIRQNSCPDMQPVALQYNAILDL